MSYRNDFSDFTDPPEPLDWEDETLDAEEDESLPSVDDEQELNDLIDDALRR